MTNNIEKKEPLFKSFIGKVITGVMVTLVSGVIIANYSGFFGNEEPSKEERNKKIFATLVAYSKDVNEKNFDAYKYFTPKVERFYQMFDTSPKKINDYVNGLFYKQFQNSTMRFDESTLSVRGIDNGEYEASVIMYSTYYKAKEKKQYTDYRSKTELRFDSNFRIKYFRQLYD